MMTKAERQKARNRIRMAAVARSSELGRSMVCGTWEAHEKCRAKVDDCLCECHDPEE